MKIQGLEINIARMKCRDMPLTKLPIPEQVSSYSVGVSNPPPKIDINLPILIACPFCGGEPNFYMHGLDLIARVNCSKCSFKMIKQFCGEEKEKLEFKCTRIEIEAKLQEHAVEAWNASRYHQKTDHQMNNWISVDDKLRQRVNIRGIYVKS